LLPAHSRHVVARRRTQRRRVRAGVRQNGMREACHAGVGCRGVVEKGNIVSRWR